MGEDYPRTILDLERRFASEEACREYLRQLRWPEGFVCPRCGGDAAWSASRGRLICRACRHQTSATAGTIFHDVRKPLVLWFRAVWCVTSQKNGASAASLQQALGLGSYQTAGLGSTSSAAQWSAQDAGCHWRVASEKCRETFRAV